MIEHFKNPYTISFVFFMYISKISAVSGDARRALDICRRAAEITEIRNGTTVTILDVNEALSEMITNPKVQAIRHCSKFEQVFLQAVCFEVTRTGVEEVCFINVYKQFEFLCSFNGLYVYLKKSYKKFYIFVIIFFFSFQAMKHPILLKHLIFAQD